jgi:hypothetical protein
MDEVYRLCSTAVAARTQHWSNWPGRGNGCGATASWGRVWTSCTLPTSRRRRPSWTTNSSLRPPTRWSEGIAGNAGCRSRFPGPVTGQPGGRLALDLQRERQAAGRQSTTKSLHRARASPK